MTKQQKEDEVNEGRRESDNRFSKIEDTIIDIKTDNKEMIKDIVYIKTRIDNGFSTSIQSTENKVNYIDERNMIEHKELKLDIKDLSKKFDKILWMFGVGTSSVVLYKFIGLLA